MGNVRIAFVLGSISLSLATLTWADDEDAIVPGSIAELREAIVDVLEEGEVPAIGIAIVDESGPVWIDAIGKANLENNIDADEHSMFRIGSTSKMFVALSVLKLVEEGKLSLDDKVAELAPDIAFENPWASSDPGSRCTPVGAYDRLGRHPFGRVRA